MKIKVRPVWKTGLITWQEQTKKWNHWYSWKIAREISRQKWEEKKNGIIDGGELDIKIWIDMNHYFLLPGRTDIREILKVLKGRRSFEILLWKRGNLKEGIRNCETITSCTSTESDCPVK